MKLTAGLCRKPSTQVDRLSFTGSLQGEDSWAETYFFGGSVEFMCQVFMHVGVHFRAEVFEGFDHEFCNCSMGGCDLH